MVDVGAQNLERRLEIRRFLAEKGITRKPCGLISSRPHCLCRWRTSTGRRLRAPLKTSARYGRGATPHCHLLIFTFRVGDHDGARLEATSTAPRFCAACVRGDATPLLSRVHSLLALRYLPLGSVFISFHRATAGSAIFSIRRPTNLLLCACDGRRRPTRQLGQWHATTHAARCRHCHSTRRSLGHSSNSQFDWRAAELAMHAGVARG